MTLTNHAGYPVELYWVNTFEPGDELVLQTEKPIRNSTHTMINSFDTHEFIVKFKDGKHKFGNIMGRFVKGPRDENIDIFFNRDESKFIIKQHSELDKWIEKISSISKKCQHSTQDFSTCMATDVFNDVGKIMDKHAFLKTQRDVVSNKYRNYTCSDDKLETSKPLQTFTYHHKGQNYKIDHLFDQSHAKIWVAHDFITDEECSKLYKEAEGKLHRATVASADGTSVVSEHRKAQQAHYSMPNENWENDPLWPLYERTIHFANKYGKLNVERPGQEDFTIIQYNPTDEYYPHCDGGCDGEPHVPGGRVATAVLYCMVPERGGATTFSKADVFVRPSKNSASIFLYKGEDGKMDEGYTEHSGCPVKEGEKWISTIWMREGVTQERGWQRVDPSGADILQQDNEAKLLAALTGEVDVGDASGEQRGEEIDPLDRENFL